MLCQLASLMLVFLFPIMYSDQLELNEIMLDEACFNHVQVWKPAVCLCGTKTCPPPAATWTARNCSFDFKSVFALLSVERC